MAIIVQVILVGISLTCLPTFVSPTNWFYSAPRALLSLAGSASASASAPATSASYVADLRKKQEKSERLQNEKDFSEQAELLDISNDKDESGGNDKEENEGNNEASPSLLEKKIGKILAKLRLIAQIKNAYHYKPEIHEHESNITFNITSIHSDRNLTNEIQTANVTEDKNVEPRLAKIKIQPENAEPIGPDVAYGVPKEPIVSLKEEVERAPLKIDLDVNKINDKLEDFDAPRKEKLTDQGPGKFGTLGIFFAELLGSIVGLTYGAFAQITSSGQSPVTISTSEGL